jgi:hypothetical protein
MKLQLALKSEYFDAIRDGTKTVEFRVDNAYWRSRLFQGHRVRTFDGIVLTKGYPKRGDPERTLELPWRGWTRKTITHPHFGPDPVEVFAINVARREALEKESEE